VPSISIHLKPETVQEYNLSPYNLPCPSVLPHRVNIHSQQAFLQSLGLYYVNYTFEPLKKGIEGYTDERLRFEFGIKL